MLNKEYQWKLLRHNMMDDPVEQGPHYDTFSLNDGPFDTVEKAEEALIEYFKQYEGNYEHTTNEEFVLITVYSQSKIWN